MEKSLTKQLTNTYKQIIHQHEKGNMKQTQRFIDKFIKQWG
ncbi:FIMAH domain-containing protein [Gracilibacillus boraciitolerans]